MNDSKTTDAISRSAVLAALHELHKQEIDEHPTVYTGIASGISQAFCVVRDAPALDVAPVVHAEWVTQGIEVYCTHCMMPQDSGTNYCPYCEAKMDAPSNVPDKNVGKLGGVINAK